MADPEDVPGMLDVMSGFPANKEICMIFNPRLSGIVYILTLRALMSTAVDILCFLSIYVTPDNQLL